MPDIKTIINIDAPAKQRIGYPGLGDELREMRKKAGYSQERIAEELGVSWMTIHRREKSLRTIDHAELIRFVEICGGTTFQPRTYTHCGVVWAETGEYRQAGDQEPFVAREVPFPQLPNPFYTPIGDRIILKAISIVGDK